MKPCNFQEKKGNDHISASVTIVVIPLAQGIFRNKNLILRDSSLRDKRQRERENEDFPEFEHAVTPAVGVHL